MTKPQVTDEQVEAARKELWRLRCDNVSPAIMRRVLEQYEASRAAPAPDPVETEREACAKIPDSWSVPSNVKLAAGEMTAQELRTAQAVARGISAAIRARKL